MKVQWNEVEIVDHQEYEPENPTVIQVHRNSDGHLLKVVKTLVNDGRMEIHVDV